MNKALFLDRDGVINYDFGHVFEISKFEFIEGIFEICKKYQEKGFLIIVITNQAGISKGFYTEDSFNKLTEYMINKFKENKIEIKDVFFESSIDDNHFRRKPNPGMIMEAIEKYNIDPKKSILIGDKTSDLIAGWKSGIEELIFLQGNYDEEKVDFKYKKVLKLKEII